MRRSSNYSTIIVFIAMFVALFRTSNAAVTLSGCTVTASFRFQRDKPAHLIAYCEFGGGLPLTAVVRDENGKVVAKDIIEYVAGTTPGRQNFDLCIFYLTWTPETDGPFTFSVEKNSHKAFAGDFGRGQTAMAFRTNGTKVTTDR